MYTGIGKRISNLAGRARPSFALIFDKNKLGANDIKISF
jgi:hypothetical protein